MRDQLLGIIDEEYNQYKISRDKAASFGGDFFMETREKLGMSMKDFGEMLGVSEETVRAWERKTAKPGFKVKKIVNFVHYFPDFGVRFFKENREDEKKPVLSNFNLVQISFYESYFKDIEEDFEFRLEEVPSLLAKHYDLKVKHEKVIETIKPLFDNLISYGEMKENGGKYTFFKRTD